MTKRPNEFFTVGESYKFQIPVDYLEKQRVFDCNFNGFFLYLREKDEHIAKIEVIDGEEYLVPYDESIAVKITRVGSDDFACVDTDIFNSDYSEKHHYNNVVPPVKNWNQWFTPVSEWLKQHPEFLPKKVGMDTVVISDEKKEQIKAAISQPSLSELIFEQWGFSEVFEKGTAVSLLFHGGPGTGKTLMAQAIADELDQELKIIGTADIESSEPGGAERAIQRLFKEANTLYEKSQKDKKIKARTLLFDECDSLLSDRNQIGVILAAQVNALLTEIERYKGVVIFTTNRLGKLDPALERRITAKIFFPKPDKAQREMIWKRMIPKKAPIHTDVVFSELAQFPLSGGNIKNIVLNAVRKAAYTQCTSIERLHFLQAIDQELEGMQDFEDEYKKTPRQARPAGGLSGTTSGGGMSLEIEKTIEKVKPRKRGA